MTEFRGGLEDKKLVVAWIGAGDLQEVAGALEIMAIDGHILGKLDTLKLGRFTGFLRVAINCHRTSRCAKVEGCHLS